MVALLSTEKEKQRRKLQGGGRKPMSEKFEEFMLDWINSKRAEGLCVQSRTYYGKSRINLC